ncbi:MAG: glycosyl hydrolase [Bacteroidota bacterium]
MKRNVCQKIQHTLLVIVLIPLLFGGCSKSEPDVGWPEINRETKPWTRWWWQGNSLQSETLPQVMEEYHQAGLGGLEITPIYGVKGYEDQFVDYLSPQWNGLLNQTLAIADSLDLGIDMANTSGWPFGGPWIGPKHACKRLVYKKYQFSGDRKIQREITFEQEPLASAVNQSLDTNDIQYPISKNDSLQQLAPAQVRFHRKLPLVSLMAYSNSEDVLNITDKVDENNKLTWQVPSGEWEVYAVFQGWHGKMVERASPGGEGNVIDHFSEAALQQHLHAFDTAFSGEDLQSIRAFFNDSYEVDDALGESNFTPGFFEAFRKRRGYDLRRHLPALFGEASKEKHQRVLCDYRETISELLLEKFTRPWKKWAHKNNAIIRNQAHGSPANILDLYGASDIPETEGTDLMRIKFASSAAHLTGKKLTSAEACTWLDEHFQATLGDVKKNIDRYLLGGVNHIVYHGTPYSPPNEQWPGWLFYAAVHFGPSNPFWHDFPALNHYVTRCQSFLQTGKPDNDLLVYFPVYDRWSNPSDRLLEHFDGGAEGTSARELGIKLQEQGYTFDFVSDRQITTLTLEEEQINAHDSRYQSIIVPETEYMPLETINHLHELANKGANVIFSGSLPDDVPGYGSLKKRKEQYRELQTNINFSASKNGIQKGEIGEGNFYIGKSVPGMLKESGIFPEPMVKDSLWFIRRKQPHGYHYFILNRSSKKIDQWVKLKNSVSSAVLYDPMNDRYGKAATGKKGSVYLQLRSGESCILETYDREIRTDDYTYLENNGDPVSINGSWKIKFVDGGPQLPPMVETKQLKSWTDMDGDIYKRFSGTASYTITFEKPEIPDTKAWLLDLGKIGESAEVSLNGKTLGTFIQPPHQLVINENRIEKNNTLEIRVSNLMANRIAYMDREGIYWKKFYNINFPARKPENRGEDGLFTAAEWEPFRSGLMGPVSLTPLKHKTFSIKSK